MAEKVNTNIAKAFDISEGILSMKIANNFLLYLEINKKKYNSILDIGFKSGNLLNIFKEKKYKCFGTETSKSMLEYTNNLHTGMNLKLVSEISSIPFLGTCDIITCINSVVSSLDAEKLPILFKEISKHLSNQGTLLLSFKTLNLPEDGQITLKTFTNLDDIITYKLNSKTQFETHHTYYLKKDEDYKKFTHSYLVNCFMASQIEEELKKVGFKKISFVDDNFNSVDGIDSQKIAYVLATKK